MKAVLYVFFCYELKTNYRDDLVRRKKGMEFKLVGNKIEINNFLNCIH